MVFTPTSWLIPRPTYAPFRRVWDQSFRYHSGFIVTSNEFFKLEGKWPLAFTLWEYEPVDDEATQRINTVDVLDLTYLSRPDLNINWNAPDDELDMTINQIISTSKTVRLDNSRGDIRELLPLIGRNGERVRQPRYDFSTAKKPNEYERLVSGLPLNDQLRHYKLKRRLGNLNGAFIGFMDDNTPVRVSQDSCHRFSNLPDRTWFRLDADIKGMNKTQAMSGSPDNRAYCAYDLPSAQALMSWFAITKALNGRYPIWANQYDIWPPQLNHERAGEWYALCMAFVLAENRCVVTKFEANNPVTGAPEVFVNNPLCPTLRDSFWSTTLASYVQENGSELAKELVNAVQSLYRHWNATYCQGNWLYGVGLKDEPYFRYFSYEDFLTPHSGLVQLRKYTELSNLTDMAQHFEKVASSTKKVREELYKLLVNEFDYFE